MLNYLMYVRGNRHDYDKWADLGNHGWDYKNALYYFKKSEDNRNPFLAQCKFIYKYINVLQTLRDFFTVIAMRAFFSSKYNCKFVLRECLVSPYIPIYFISDNTYSLYKWLHVCVQTNQITQVNITPYIHKLNILRFLGI